jgi:hypothetical protein
VDLPAVDRSLVLGGTADSFYPTTATAGDHRG